MSPPSAPPPIVTCVMIFFNGSRFIDEAIRSVVRQQDLEEWELILVDDGSTDASTAIAQQWAEADHRIRYVEHPGHVNRGMSESRNLGIDSASGRYVTFLDCDDVLLPWSFAHRVRVAAAFPDADVVVGGAWWWHSWRGPAVESPSDFALLLPVAPPLVELDPPRLFEAMYGVPGAAHAPAICALLFRREALRAIGGLQAEFTGMYEDQVLYVKAGLKLRAVVDPRRLALYRQHPDSACAVALANGEWRRWDASPTLTAFHAWLEDYVAREAGTQSREWQIVQRDIEHAIDPPDPYGSGLRGALRRRLPEPVKASIRSVRRLATRRQPRVSVLATWSEQFLAVTTASASGTAAVLLGRGTREHWWTGDIPDSAFGVDSAVSRHVLSESTAGVFDNVVVPFDAAAELPIAKLLDVMARRLDRGGCAAAVIPGPAWHRPNGSAGARHDAKELQRLARERFPEMRISVETFGNEFTARAVAERRLATAVEGVAIDCHDPNVQVMLALSVSPARIEPTPDRERAKSLNHGRLSAECRVRHGCRVRDGA